MVTLVLAWTGPVPLRCLPHRTSLMCHSNLLVAFELPMDRKVAPRLAAPVGALPLDGPTLPPLQSQRLRRPSLLPQTVWLQQPQQQQQTPRHALVPNLAQNLVRLTRKAGQRIVAMPLAMLGAQPVLEGLWQSVVQCRC